MTKKETLAIIETLLELSQQWSAQTMNLEYYIINGRGDDGLKFQLAKLKDEAGNNYKGQYDMSRHFGSVDEMKEHIANDVVKKPLSELSIEPMNI